MTVPAVSPRRNNPIATDLLRRQLPDAVWIAAAYIVAVALVTAVVSVFVTIETSAWEVATGIPRWFIGGWGVFLTGVYLPLYIAHGYTRRESARQAPAFVAALSLVLGAAMAIGYGLEWVVYRALDWPQVISSSLLFDAPTQFPLIMLEHTLIFLVWTSAGMLVGAAFYRNSGWAGFVVLPVAIVSLVLTEAFTARSEIELVGILWWQFSSPPLALAAAVYTVVVAGLAALTWRLVRDIPVRAKNT